MPHQNWSQHARLLPYMEQNPAYNSINWSFGARWSDNARGYTETYPQVPMVRPAVPTAWCSTPCSPCTINSFLCPSDTNPGSSGTFIVGGTTKTIGASNYCHNIGLNRRINGGVADQQLADQRSHLHGDQLGRSPEARPLASTTSPMERATRRSSASGSRDRQSELHRDKNGLAIIYNLGQNSDYCPVACTDYQFKLACDQTACHQR